MPESNGQAARKTDNPFDSNALTRDATALRAALDDGRTAPAMANKLLAAFRGVIRETWRMGLIDAETMTRLVDLLAT